MTELIAIPFSHFCEKARWGLERAGVPFRELRVLPMLHLPVVGWALRGTDAGAADAHSSRLSTPVLLTSGGPVCGSTAILRYADASLLADAAVERWVTRFDEVLGPHTRRMAYFLVFETPGVLRELAAANTDRFQTTLLRAIEGVAVPRMRAAMKIDRAGFERSHRLVGEVMDEVAEALSDGRRHLTGARFTAADLTFAALLAPLILPEGYGATMPRPERFDAEAQELIAATRAHPAGRWALELYRRERVASHPASTH